MKHAYAIACREMGSYFRLPAGWVIIALYMFLTGAVFGLNVLVSGNAATLRQFFGVSAWLLLPVIPAVSMRLISEELRTGTMETLLTAPVSDASVVVGKYLGAAGFLLAMLTPTILYPVLLHQVSDPAPDVGPFIAGYLCLILQGMLFLAVGTLWSSLTSNQTLAFLTTLFTLLMLLMLPTFLNRLPASLQPVLTRLTMDERIDDFAKGVIDTTHVVFFASAAALVLLAAVICVQVRRWK